MKIQVANIQKQSFGGVLRNFAKFTAKHLCQSLFLNKVAGSSLFMEHIWWLLVILQIWFLKEKIWSKWPPFYKQQVASVLLESCYYNFIEIVNVQVNKSVSKQFHFKSSNIRGYQKPAFSKLKLFEKDYFWKIMQMIFCYTISWLWGFCKNILKKLNLDSEKRTFRGKNADFNVP